MSNPKKGSLAHKRKIQAEGANAFHNGLTRDHNHYGSFQPVLRQLWDEGFDEANRLQMIQSKTSSKER